MKTTRSVRTIAVLLALCLCVTMLPGTAIALEAEVPAAEKRAVTLEDVVAGIADSSELYEPLDPNTVPEIIGYGKAQEMQHVKRSYADEGNDLNKVVFENLDGTKTMYLFDFPVKYRASDGAIRDISLEIADKASGGFQTAANSTVTTFSTQASDGISLSGNGTSITLKPIIPAASKDTQISTGTATRGSISTEELTLSHTASRVDEKTVQYRYDSKTTIEYSLTYTGFKEDIVVSQYTGQTEYAFTLQTGGYALEEMDGSYFLVDDAGNIKATIGDIIIFTADQRNNTMGRLVPTTIVENQEYLLTIVIDPEFLADENTAYPIRIDPTVEINYNNNGAGAILDATVYTDDTTNGALGSIFVGLKQNGGIARILMQFPGLDLSSLGTNVYIHEATVTLRDLLCESTSLDVYCHVFNGGDWDESYVSWDTTIGDGTDYLSNQLDMKTISYSVGTTLSEQHRYSFNITEAVRGWRDGSYDYLKGIIFKASTAVENGSTYNWRTLGSYNRASYKPTLSVTYGIDNIISEGTYYLNNDDSGKYLRYNGGSASGTSGLLANLGTSIQWEILNNNSGSGCVIRSKNDTTKYLGVPENTGSDNIEIVTVSGTAVPSRCIWAINLAYGGGCLVRSTYNSKYLFSSGGYLYTSSTTGTYGTSTYSSRVWRIANISRYGNASSHFYGEFEGGSTINDLIVNIGEINSPTINAMPSNVLWAEKKDFTFLYSSGTSDCVSISLPSNVFLGTKCGIATYIATHKVTGRQLTLNVYVDRYTYELVNSFGFSSDVSLLIRDLYNRIDAVYSSKTEKYKAWVASRVLSEFSYDDSTTYFDIISINKWDDVAGSVTSPESRKSYFVHSLGYTETEYNAINSALISQHSNTQTSDFTHMQYSLASRLAYKLNQTGVLSNIYTLSGDETVSYLAGWFGDATLTNAEGLITFGNDDYMADLDAENLFRRINGGEASITAINSYYKILSAESSNRATIFKSYLSYSTVESMVLSKLDMTLDQVKISHSDTYDFLMSLKDSLSEIDDY